ncbi:uncharacterized protein VP01_1488g2 [Puccinia sorghi]|uniref:HAT C-terminal dimerisation domain-containing protein n=1 Tax=Puccinia sorghi TaxID=27349 RepID=A0A0L6VLA3_9BASI|nr:uncharacterized protein VP01_1488g2 [Puccinia sorghi]
MSQLGGTLRSKCFTDLSSFTHRVNTSAQMIVKQLNTVYWMPTTEILCASKYPILNKALPVYIVLMKHLKRIQCGLYNQDQLIEPATWIIWKKNKWFIMDYFHVSVTSVVETFQEIMDAFDAQNQKKQTNQARILTSILMPPKKRNSSLFASEIYEANKEVETQTNSHAELTQYLKEDLKPEGTNFLHFWASKTRKYPILSSLARIYLSITAKSAPSDPRTLRPSFVPRSCFSLKTEIRLCFIYCNSQMAWKISSNCFSGGYSFNEAPPPPPGPHITGPPTILFQNGLRFICSCNKGSSVPNCSA